MDLFSDIDKAYSCAIRRFYRQKSDDPVYIYRVNVARREMWTVLSTAEIKANKITAKSAWMAVDGRYGLLEAKHKRQEREGEDAEIRLMIKAARGYRQFRKAQEKLEKMERGAKAPKADELDTAEA